MLGPARSVRAWGWSLLPERTTLDGDAVPDRQPGSDRRRRRARRRRGPAPDRELLRRTPCAGRSAASSSTAMTARSHWAISRTSTRRSRSEPFGKAYEPVPLVRPGYRGTAWARGVADMASAIVEGRPHRASARAGRPRGGHPRGRGRVHRGRRQPDRDHVQLRAAVAHALGGRWGRAGRRSLGSAVRPGLPDVARTLLAADLSGQVEWR